MDSAPRAYRLKASNAYFTFSTETGTFPWSVSLAYFATDSNNPAPEHEIKMRLFANGVADDLIMDFGDFIVRARLGKIELLADPSCR